MKFLIAIWFTLLALPALGYNPCSPQETLRIRKERVDVLQYFKKLAPHLHSHALYFEEHACFVATENADGSRGLVKIPFADFERWQDDPIRGEFVRVVLPERSTLACSMDEKTVMGESMHVVVDLGAIAPTEDRLDLFVRVSNFQSYLSTVPLGPELQEIIPNPDLRSGVVLTLPLPVDTEGAERIRIQCLR